MAQRIVKILLPESHASEVAEVLKGQDLVGYWQEERDGGQSVVSVLTESEQVEKLMDLLKRLFSHVEGFRMVVLPVEASLPDSTEKEPLVIAPRSALGRGSDQRISREELYADVIDGTKFSPVYMIMISLSTVVAAIGLLRDNVAVVIGAMVIAPMLGPNVALALASTLADLKLGKEAMRTFALGVLLSLCIGFLVGLAMEVDPSVPEIASRTEISMFDIVLGLAAGTAGVMAFTTGASSAVIGVMVAVALLPPLVASGMLAGAGFWDLALGAFLLFACNVISVNLAGVTTFILRGIRPMTWWEEDRAAKAKRMAIAFWSLLLCALIVVVILGQ